MLAQEELVVGFEAVGLRQGARRPEDGHLQGLGNVAGDLVLDDQDLAELAVEISDQI